jgi:superfamily II DNA or RNA helicase
VGRRSALTSERDRTLALSDDVARARERVAALKLEYEREAQRLYDLEAQLAALDAGATAAGQVSVVDASSMRSEASESVKLPSRTASGPVEQGARTAHEKLAIFRGLFRGRSDVYPTRFVSREGKQGYGPACANKFVRGTCELPRVKCGECRNQAFLPADDDAYLAHLRGEHVMGVYPMLSDGTCWFLAVDFDKATWTDDVRAFIGTCRRLALPYAVERSRSGNGAHVWFFFTAPVAAWAARKLGCYVLTETMAARHELSLDSYDRLFPSQDHMPKGGFGNLIALPLQREARAHGNTEMLDNDLEPLPGEQQWELLDRIPRISPATVERLVAEASRNDRVLGVRASGPVDEPTLVSLRTRRPARVDGPLPPRVSAVLADRLTVSIDRLPSPLISALRQAAAFENPEFHKKQALRLSTARTPRVISCAEMFEKRLTLPRGCLKDVVAILEENGVALELDDQRTSGTALNVRFNGTLTPIQQAAARAILDHEIGVFVAPPGIGKTVIGTYLTAARGRSTLVLVHRAPLLDQWRSQLAMFLGLDIKTIGQVGSGKDKRSGTLDVAMVQSLARREDFAQVVGAYGHVIVDECHHVSAVSFERVVAASKARFVLGLTATPKRRDGHHPIVEMQLGPVRYAVDAKSQAGRRPFEHRLFARETAFRAATADAPIQDLYAQLAQDSKRNRMIIDDVIAAIEGGRSPIVLTERTDHLEYLASELKRVARHVIVLRGGMGAKQTREVFARMVSIPPSEERVVIATGRYIGEGFDDARLDTLFLTLPVSWKGTLIQYAGRLHRLHPDKREVQVYDYVDREVPMLFRMFEKRLRGYRSIGYARGEAPLGIAPPKEMTIEYDDDAFIAAEPE